MNMKQVKIEINESNATITLTKYVTLDMAMESKITSSMNSDEIRGVNESSIFTCAELFNFIELSIQTVVHP